MHASETPQIKELAKSVRETNATKEEVKKVITSTSLGYSEKQAD